MHDMHDTEQLAERLGDVLHGQKRNEVVAALGIIATHTFLTMPAAVRLRIAASFCDTLMSMLEDDTPPGGLQ